MEWGGAEGKGWDTGDKARDRGDQQSENRELYGKEGVPGV